MMNRIISIFRKLFYKKKKNNIRDKFSSIGENVDLPSDLIVAGEKNISIGSNVYIGPRCIFYAGDAPLTIGSHVMFGPEVMIITGDHRIDIKDKLMDEITVEMKLPENDQPVVIEDDVWIGARALILKGITIGRGSVIAAGVTVLQNVPRYSIYYGKNKIRPRFKD